MKKAIVYGVALASLCGLAAANAATVNLLTAPMGGAGFGSLPADPARFVRAENRSSGTGVIQSFVRLQNAPNEQGYNTSGRPLQFDENTSPNFTRNLTFGQIPSVVGTGAFGLTNGTVYKEFLLDINQMASSPGLSLDRLRIQTNAAPNLNTLGNFTSLPLGSTLVYDMGTTNNVLLDYSLNTGSGQGDMALYIPAANFGAANANTFVYLYSQFGLSAPLAGFPNFTFITNDGFEEWSVQTSQQLIPLPPAVWMGMASLAGLGVLRLRKARLAR